MPRFAQLVIGPAGSGKSTYCKEIQEHCAATGRTVHVVNLDPAADAFKYQVSLDVRDLISLEDVMEEMKLGPNGGLLYCMEYLEESLEEWLQAELDDYSDDDYLLFDCPGQIELYSHVPVFRSFVDTLRMWDFNLCAVYLLDANFVNDGSKFIAGCMQALSAMVMMEVPHVNVLTKMDTVQNKKTIRQFLDFDARMLAQDLDSGYSSRMSRLNNAVAGLVDDYSMVSFITLDITKEDSIQGVLSQIDYAIQYGEDLEIKAKMDLGDQDPEEQEHPDNEWLGSCINDGDVDV
mmetsp:Transcript_4409/g.8325  ORF Transcript_4409/g.8325 Transcript_4409/m.8325 type:complete len:291 (+) Transcript_4409:150-1022(+)|eukprot:CAMPEP_0114254084 /NCGR_PEP_ID=MMETSP0058-20121206/16775_1 /TAXON_ID=36894 /ORGANISM="Pyramimonas parkeae, CCMP726" /LENGTH=290 /DNA_ID=CAMNT_0001368249 /DNA_START=77 /DNA_END=949 /DNA_ORIENTATION=+